MNAIVRRYGGEVVLSNTVFHFITSLQYKVKNLTEQVRKFKSGEMYQAIVGFYEQWLASKDREIKKLKFELGEVRAQYVDVRNNWQEVIEDLEAEHTKAIARKDRANNAVRQQLVKAQSVIDDLKDKLISKTKQCYQALTELEEEKGKVQKLKAQINRDYETSGIPSSISVNKKKITNNREKTGRKPGGQPGHPGHRRRQYEPTASVEIPPTQRGNPNYRPTGRTITKQLIDVQVNLVVTEWHTLEYRDIFTGQRVHADFPAGLVNEVTYGPSVKALAFIVQNHCNVSIMKTSDLLYEITGGKLRLSAGLISNLAKEFSQRSEQEQKAAFADMLLAPAMNIDFTSARVNGKNHAVLVCSNGTQTIYIAKEHKGHKGIEGTPVADYQGTLIHDHDKTFYSYGGNHQECLEHIRRYLKDGMLNEPDRKWHGQMRQLINEMLHFKKELDPDDNLNPDEIDPGKVAAFEARYDEILSLAADEYEYEPPNMKYYPEGFNLYKRMMEYRVNHLLFLHDKNVDPTNNLSERFLRTFKRKQHQVMTFRSHEGLSSLCDSLGVISSFVNQGKNLFESVSTIFSPPFMLNTHN